MKKKLAIVVMAGLVGVGLGGALGYGPLLRYKSEGMLSMEMGVAEYKRYVELATDASNVRQFAAMSLPADTDSRWVDRLVMNVRQGQWFKPVPKVSKTDSKELPDSMLQMSKDTSQSVYMGLRLNYAAANPEEAAKVATFLGGYFKDVATREAVRELVSDWKSQNLQFSERATEQKLQHQFAIEQAQTRVVELKRLVSSYPDVVKWEVRQMVDVRKDNEKFMSPMAQLVGAESEIIDIRERIRGIDRQMEQQAFVKSVVVDSEAVLSQSGSGSQSVLKLSNVILHFSKQIKTEAEREKLSSLAADLSQISARFLSQAQFIAKPAVPVKPERPGPLLLMVLGGFFVAFVSAVFLWRESIWKMLQQESESEVIRAS